MTALARLLDRCAAWLLVGVIRSYWMLVPVHRRRTCLFRTSCSRFVHATALGEGGRAGWRALAHRWRCCRPGAHAELHGGTWYLRLADGTLAGEADLVDAALTPYRLAVLAVPATPPAPTSLA